MLAAIVPASKTPGLFIHGDPTQHRLGALVVDLEAAMIEKELRRDDDASVWRKASARADSA